MEQNAENKIQIKDRLVSFYNGNKLKIYAISFLIIIISFSVILTKINIEKKNNLNAEKYVQAGLYLAADDKKKAKKIYEEIILSKNKFYSNLAFNTIMEKDLEKDKNKILTYFEILEGLNYTEEKKDLITLKKALYLIKNSEIEDGNSLLKKIIEKESNLKSIAEEIITK
jgi:activator of 2-hydroxyglutaryl-CoA dehydratase